MRGAAAPSRGTIGTKHVYVYISTYYVDIYTYTCFVCRLVIWEETYESTKDTCVIEDDGTDGRDCGQRKPQEVERNRVIIKRRNREFREEDGGGQRKRRVPFQKK